MLSLGHRAMFRASELCKIKYEHVKYMKTYLQIILNDSKTGKHVVKVPPREGKQQDLCPMILLGEWFKRTNIRSGYLFPKINGSNLSSSPVSSKDLQKMLDKVTNLLPGNIRCTPHSLRAGGATEALENGIDSQEIAKLGRWKSSALSAYLVKAKPSSTWYDSQPSHDKDEFETKEVDNEDDDQSDKEDDDPQDDYESDKESRLFS